MSDNHNQKDQGLDGEQTLNPGGDKVDPVSAGVSTKDTIAGRDLSSGGTVDLSNQGAPAVRPHHEAGPGATQRGGPETSLGGVSGTTGQPDSSAHDGPENQAEQSK